MNITLCTILLIGLSIHLGVAQENEMPLREVDQKEYALGQADARGDLKEGKIVYEIVGQPSMIDLELKKIAMNKYGITVKFHGCSRGPRVDYDQGYLDTVIDYLKEKYSFDPVQKIEKELQTKNRE